MSDPGPQVLDPPETRAARRRPPQARSARQPIQARAHLTRQALLDAGRRLLAGRSLDALSIAEVASAIDMSVGSFYGRFADKEAFFAQLQRQVTDEWRATVQAELRALAALAAPQIVRRVCALVIGLMRTDAGFLRSALKHASTHPGSWTPIKQVGLDTVQQLAPLLAAKFAGGTRPQREQRVWVAMQVVFSTGLNAVLNDPGPLHLADSKLEKELARLMAAYLGIPDPWRRT